MNALFMLCLSCAGSRPERSADELPALLAQLPADDPAAAERIEQAILEMPPGTMQALCLQLQSPDSTTNLTAHYALSGLAKHVSASGRERERRRFVAGITASLQSEMPAAAKTFLIEQLQQAGGKEAIPVLADYLAHPRLADPAARALVSIGGKPAEEALLRALPETAFPMRGHIIAALGMMGSARATGPLLNLAEGEHALSRRAALEALANIGDPAAEACFTRVLANADSTSRREATVHYLRFARRLGENGQRQRSAALSRQLLATPEQLHPAEYSEVLRLRVDMAGGEALPALLAAADHPERQIRAAALEIARQIPGKKNTGLWVEKMKAAPPEIRPELLDLLGRRGDAFALAAVLGQIADPAPAVRLAALEAAVQLDRAAGLNAMLDLLTTVQDPEAAQQIRQIFQTSYGAAGLQRLAETIDSATPAGQVMILELIGEREAAAFRETVRAKTVSADRKVRLAAIRAFGPFATLADRPGLLALLHTAPGAAEQNALQKILARASRQASAESERLAPFLAALQTGEARQSERILPILAMLGGQPALEAVIAATKDPHPGRADAAVRALADWPDPAALAALQQLAQSAEQQTHRVLALRGLIRLAGADTTAAQPLRIKRYQTALELAESAAEKRLILAGIAELPAPETLALAGNLLNDPELQAEAEAAILKMSEHEPLHPLKQLEILLQRIADSAADASMRIRAAKQLEAIAARQSAPGDATVSAADSRSGKQPKYTGEDEFHNQPPAGFTALFNGKDLFGWKGLVENPPARRALTAAALAGKQAQADSIMRRHWRAEAGELRFDGEGFYNICTAKDYRNFELLIDWKIGKNGDSGLYLRGCPQVQIWDPEQWQTGSGGLYNNQQHPKDPPVIADNPAGEWNRFCILMQEERVTVYLNNILVVDDVVLENYWERGKPLYPFGQIELQAHKTPLAFRNIFIREIDPAPARTVALFNGTDLRGWQIIGGSEDSWGVEDSLLYTTGSGGGWLATEREYGDFRLELDFRLPPGGNSGVFLRAPRDGDPAYQGMEIQVLDDRAPQYADLKPWQYCGSLYAVQPPAQRVSKPAGEWQHYEVTCRGPEVLVKLNGEMIIDLSLIDHMEKTARNPGLQRRKGFIGLQNHGDRVEYRNIRITEL